MGAARNAAVVVASSEEAPALMRCCCGCRRHPYRYGDDSQAAHLPQPAAELSGRGRVNIRAYAYYIHASMLDRSVVKVQLALQMVRCKHFKGSDGVDDGSASRLRP
jgi:hypothetical protein